MLFYESCMTQYQLQTSTVEKAPVKSTVSYSLSYDNTEDCITSYGQMDNQEKLEHDQKRSSLHSAFTVLFQYIFTIWLNRHIFGSTEKPSISQQTHKGSHTGDTFRLLLMRDYKTVTLKLTFWVDCLKLNQMHLKRCSFDKWVGLT